MSIELTDEDRALEREVDFFVIRNIRRPPNMPKGVSYSDAYIPDAIEFAAALLEFVVKHREAGYCAGLKRAAKAESESLALWVECFADCPMDGTANKGKMRQGPLANPFAYEQDDSEYCFFCGVRDIQIDRHAANCIWVRAKALVTSST